jgi:hypothetical protein
VAVVIIDVSEERIVSIIRVNYLLITADAPSSLILFTLIMEAIHSSETSVLTITTRPHIPEESILQDTFMFAWRYRKDVGKVKNKK